MTIPFVICEYDKRGHLASEWALYSAGRSVIVWHEATIQHGENNGKYVRSLKGTNTAHKIVVQGEVRT